MVDYNITTMDVSLPYMENAVKVLIRCHSMQLAAPSQVAHELQTICVCVYFIV